jgi:hypothetical protein
VSFEQVSPEGAKESREAQARYRAALTGICRTFGAYYFLSKNHGLFLMLRDIALALRAPVAKVFRRSAALIEGASRVTLDKFWRERTSPGTG